MLSEDRDKAALRRKSMEQPKIATVGVGATGTAMAAAIMRKYPETILVGRNPNVGDTLLAKGTHVSGAIRYQCPLNKFVSQIEALSHSNPERTNSERAGKRSNFYCVGRPSNICSPTIKPSRAALPVLSPSPLAHECTTSAPTATASNSVATPRPKSLCLPLRLRPSGG
jgi:hypothetical protein